MEDEELQQGAPRSGEGRDDKEPLAAGLSGPVGMDVSDVPTAPPPPRAPYTPPTPDEGKAVPAPPKVGRLVGVLYSKLPEDLRKRIPEDRFTDMMADSSKREAFYDKWQKPMGLNPDRDRFLKSIRDQFPRQRVPASRVTGQVEVKAKNIGGEESSMTSAWDRAWDWWDNTAVGSWAKNTYVGKAVQQGQIQAEIKQEGELWNFRQFFNDEGLLYDDADMTGEDVARFSELIKAKRLIGEQLAYKKDDNGIRKFFGEAFLGFVTSAASAYSGTVQDVQAAHEEFGFLASVPRAASFSAFMLLSGGEDQAVATLEDRLRKAGAKAGLDPENPEDMATLLNDPSVRQTARRDAVTAGVIVTGAEAVGNVVGGGILTRGASARVAQEGLKRVGLNASARMAGRVADAVPFQAASKLGRLGAATVVEATADGAGEIAKNLAIGDDVTIYGVAQEVVGGLGSSTTTTLAPATIKNFTDKSQTRREALAADAIIEAVVDPAIGLTPQVMADASKKMRAAGMIRNADSEAKTQDMVAAAYEAFQALPDDIKADPVAAREMTQVVMQRSRVTRDMEVLQAKMDDEGESKAKKLLLEKRRNKQMAELKAKENALSAGLTDAGATTANMTLEDHYMTSRLHRAAQEQGINALRTDFSIRKGALVVKDPAQRASIEAAAQSAGIEIVNPGEGITEVGLTETGIGVATVPNAGNVEVVRVNDRPNSVTMAGRGREVSPVSARQLGDALAEKGRTLTFDPKDQNKSDKQRIREQRTWTQLERMNAATRDANGVFTFIPQADRKDKATKKLNESVAKAQAAQAKQAAAASGPVNTPTDINTPVSSATVNTKSGNRVFTPKSGKFKVKGSPVENSTVTIKVPGKGDVHVVMTPAEKAAYDKATQKATPAKNTKAPAAVDVKKAQRQSKRAASALEKAQTEAKAASEALIEATDSHPEGSPEVKAAKERVAKAKKAVDRKQKLKDKWDTALAEAQKKGPTKPGGKLKIAPVVDKANKAAEDAAQDGSQTIVDTRTDGPRESDKALEKVRQAAEDPDLTDEQVNAVLKKAGLVRDDLPTVLRGDGARDRDFDHARPIEGESYSEFIERQKEAAYVQNWQGAGLRSGEGPVKGSRAGMSFFIPESAARQLDLSVAETQSLDYQLFVATQLGLRDPMPSATSPGSGLGQNTADLIGAASRGRLLNEYERVAVFEAIIRYSAHVSNLEKELVSDTSQGLDTQNISERLMKAQDSLYTYQQTMVSQNSRIGRALATTNVAFKSGAAIVDAAETLIKNMPGIDRRTIEEIRARAAEAATTQEAVNQARQQRMKELAAARKEQADIAMEAAKEADLIDPDRIDADDLTDTEKKAMTPGTTLSPLGGKDDPAANAGKRPPGTPPPPKRGRNQLTPAEKDYLKQKREEREAAMTQAEKDARAQRRKDARAERLAGMTVAERLAAADKRRAEAKKRRDAMPDDVKKALDEDRKRRRAEEEAAMTAEQKAERDTERKARAADRQKNMTIDERVAAIEKRRLARQAREAAMTPQQKEDRRKAREAAKAAADKIRDKEKAKRKAEWDALTQEQRDAIEAQRKADREQKRQDREAAKTPEQRNKEREQRRKKRQAELDKMTEAEKAAAKEEAARVRAEANNRLTPQEKEDIRQMRRQERIAKQAGMTKAEKEAEKAKRKARREANKIADAAYDAANDIDVQDDPKNATGFAAPGKSGRTSPATGKPMTRGEEWALERLTKPEDGTPEAFAWQARQDQGKGVTELNFNAAVNHLVRFYIKEEIAAGRDPSLNEMAAKVAALVNTVPSYRRLIDTDQGTIDPATGRMENNRILDRVVEALPLNLKEYDRRIDQARQSATQKLTKVAKAARAAISLYDALLNAHPNGGYNTYSLENRNALRKHFNTLAMAAADSPLLTKNSVAFAQLDHALAQLESGKLSDNASMTMLRTDMVKALKLAGLWDGDQVSPRRAQKDLDIQMGYAVADTAPAVSTAAENLARLKHERSLGALHKAQQRAQWKARYNEASVAGKAGMLTAKTLRDVYMGARPAVFAFDASFLAGQSLLAFATIPPILAFETASMAISRLRGTNASRNTDYQPATTFANYGFLGREMIQSLKTAFQGNDAALGVQARLMADPDIAEARSLNSGFFTTMNSASSVNQREETFSIELDEWMDRWGDRISAENIIRTLTGKEGRGKFSIYGREFDMNPLARLPKIVAGGFRFSEASFTNTMNVVRAFKYKQYVLTHPEASKADRKKYAEWVMDMTGRGVAKGKIGAVMSHQGTAVILAAPRLYLGQIKTVGQAPVSAVQVAIDLAAAAEGKPVSEAHFAHREILKQYGALAATYAGYQMLKSMPEEEKDEQGTTFAKSGGINYDLKYVKTNDWLKERWADKSYDLTGGMGAWVRILGAAAYEASIAYEGQKAADERFGAATSVNQASVRQRTGIGQLGRTLQGKLNPINNTLISLATGQDAIGRSLGSATGEVAGNLLINGFLPIMLQDPAKKWAGLKKEIDLEEEGISPKLEGIDIVTRAAVSAIGANITYYDNNARHVKVVEYLEALNWKLPIDKTLAEAYVASTDAGTIPFYDIDDSIHKENVTALFKEAVEKEVGTWILAELQQDRRPSENDIWIKIRDYSELIGPKVWDMEIKGRKWDVGADEREQSDEMIERRYRALDGEDFRE